jgi:hypothetical protein
MRIVIIMIYFFICTHNKIYRCYEINLLALAYLYSTNYTRRWMRMKPNRMKKVH